MHLKANNKGLMFPVKRLLIKGTVPLIMDHSLIAQLFEEDNSRCLSLDLIENDKHVLKDTIRGELKLELG